MSKYIPGNQKHLSLEDRKYIERSLNNGSTFKDIARFLCKDPTTISKEVKLHRVSDWYHKGSFLNAHNFCIHRYHCRKTNVCRKIILCNIKCTSCPTCNQTCPDFVKEQCNRLDKAPYVCNGCPNAIHHCSIAHKYRYDAVFADRKYKECLSSSRAGINMTKHELHQKDMVISPLIYQGQSPYQIITNHPELDMSVRTLYSYLNDGVLTARNVDLKRKVKFKPRKVHKTQIKDRTVFQGRIFSDFQKLELEDLDIEKCRDLFEIIESRDCRKATIIISQIPVSGWYQLFGDSTYADACLSRMTSKAYRLEFPGRDRRVNNGN